MPYGVQHQTVVSPVLYLPLQDTAVYSTRVLKKHQRNLCHEDLTQLWIKLLDGWMDGWIRNWVQGLSAPTHLGLNRRALCAPYRIMGAVASRYKILIISGSKKGTQIYYFFSLRSPRKRTPSMFTSGASMERNTHPQGIYVSLTYLLTPWCRVLLEKLTGLQLVKKFPEFYGTRRFITALTSVRHLSLSCASPIQSTYPHPTSWRSIFTYLRISKRHNKNSSNKKALRKRRPSMFPKSGAPTETRRPFPSLT